jgi:hypothetical protein
MRDRTQNRQMIRFLTIYPEAARQDAGQNGQDTRAPVQLLNRYNNLIMRHLAAD